MTKHLFKLGQLVATPAALSVLESSKTPPEVLLARHLTGDWGDLCEEDLEMNDKAVRIGERILSSYNLTNGEKVWIITEWDRSATTILLPSDY